MHPVSPRSGGGPLPEGMRTGPGSARRSAARGLTAAGTAVVALVSVLTAIAVGRAMSTAPAGWSQPLLLGLIGLPVVALVVAGVGAELQRVLTRPPDLIRTLLVDGDVATVVRGRTTMGWAAWVGTATSLSALLGALVAWPSLLPVVLLLAVAGYAGLGAWLCSTGALGDGSVILTRSGIRQRSNGVEQSARWNDLVVMRPHPEGLSLGSRGGVALLRTAPRGYWGAHDVAAQEFVLRLANQHPGIDFAGAILAWTEDLSARSEIGSPLAAERLLGRPLFDSPRADPMTSPSGYADNRDSWPPPLPR